MQATAESLFLTDLPLKLWCKNHGPKTYKVIISGIIRVSRLGIYAKVKGLPRRPSALGGLASLPAGRQARNDTKFMDPQKIQKIENLIIQSKILSPGERAEWLALLDLMNDKQLGELEAILLGARESQVTSDKSQYASRQFSAKPLTQTLGTTPASLKEKIIAATPPPQQPNLPQQPKGLPKLSHIMNLPKWEGLQDRADKGDKLRVTGDKPQPNIGQSKFAQMLKAEIEEKELPAPQSEKELVSPAGSATSPRQKTEVEASAKVFNSILREKQPLPPPVVPVPKGKQVTSDKLQVTGDFLPRQVSADKRVEADKPQVTSYKLPVINPVQVDKANRTDATNMTNTAAKPLPLVQEKLAVQKPSEPVKPPVIPEIQSMVNKILSGKMPATGDVGGKGLNKLPDQFLEKSFAMAPKVTQPKAPDVLTKTQPQEAPLELKTLENLVQVDESNLRAGYDVLALQIQGLIRKFGYHAVVFNLEKSPLHQKYLNTGAAALKQQTTFESMDKTSPDGLLDRKKFEQVADLLRAIQAS